MIQFFVTGTPISQGSMNAFCPTAEDPLIQSTIRALRTAGGPFSVTLANRFEARGKKSPKFKRYKDKPGGYYEATMRASNSTKLGKWRKAIAAAAREGRPLEPLGQPVEVIAIFWFCRPKVHYRTGKYSHILRDTAPDKHTQKPDVDKLLRALLDGLTGSLIVDDSFVHFINGEKKWLPRREDAEGVQIYVTPK